MAMKCRIVVTERTCRSLNMYVWPIMIPKPLPNWTLIQMHYPGVGMVVYHHTPQEMLVAGLKATADSGRSSPKQKNPRMKHGSGPRYPLGDYQRIRYGLRRSL